MSKAKIPKHRRHGQKESKQQDGANVPSPQTGSEMIKWLYTYIVYVI